MKRRSATVKFTSDRPLTVRFRMPSIFCYRKDWKKLLELAERYRLSLEDAEDRAKRNYERWMEAQRQIAQEMRDYHASETELRSYMREKLDEASYTREKDAEAHRAHILELEARWDRQWKEREAATKAAFQEYHELWDREEIKAERLRDRHWAIVRDNIRLKRLTGWVQQE